MQQQPDQPNTMGPGYRSQPDYPVQPAAPGAIPQQQGVPMQPMQPMSPVQPGQQYAPVQPGQPGQPGQQYTPDQPVQPGQQYTPVQPVQPGQPYTPGQPGQQYAPVQPTQPYAPAQAGQVGQPVQPVGQPGQPGQYPPAAMPPGTATDQPQPSQQPDGMGDEGRWMRLSSLIGRSIVDLGSGTKVGEIEDVALSPDHRSMEAYVTKGRLLHGADAFPAHGSTIGADAVTLPAGALQNFDTRRVEGLPLARTLAGMRLLTDTGRLIGTVKDLRFDPQTGAVLVFELEGTPGGFFQRLVHRSNLLPATAVQQYGTDALIIGEADAQQYLGERQ